MDDPPLPLRAATSSLWTEIVLADFDVFLLDHAAAEKKASGMALSMLSHYPDKPELVRAMTDLAVEELAHFREVVRWIQQRGLQLGADEKDPYVNELREHIQRGRDNFFLDRLLSAAVIEARGAERFGLIATHAPDDALRRFYHSIARSEHNHYQLFIDLAKRYFPSDRVDARWDQWLDIEARTVESLPPRPALH